MVSERLMAATSSAASLSKFRQALENDVVNVFLNEDEFAETHDLETRARSFGSVVCVIDTDITSPADGPSAHPWNGLSSTVATVYAKPGTLPDLMVGEDLSIDGELHVVRKISREMGMLIVTAEKIED